MIVDGRGPGPRRAAVEGHRRNGATEREQDPGAEQHRSAMTPSVTTGWSGTTTATQRSSSEPLAGRLRGQVEIHPGQRRDVVGAQGKTMDLAPTTASIV